MKRFVLFLLAASMLLACDRDVQGPFRVTDLQVNYMTTPLGIDDASPRFSWKMESDRYGQVQDSCRIVVTESVTGVTVWDSEPMLSDLSVGFVYRGEPLKPCTRYDWTVTVTNAASETVSAGSWFETGLLDGDWSGAQWISSGQPHFSKYRSHYDIEFDLSCTGEDPRPVFVFGRQDEKNFVSLELSGSSAVLRHTTDGVDSLDWEAPLKALPAHLCVRVYGLDYAKGYRVWLIADNVPVNKEPVVVQPYPLDVWKPDCRFNQVGFAQLTPGCEAVFSNLTVKERVWHSTLYQSDESVKVTDGTVVLRSPAEESGAPMLRKTFRVEKPLASARLYTTARGIYEYEVNGKPLADDWFNPGSSDYRYRIFYNTMT